MFLWLHWIEYPVGYLLISAQDPKLARPGGMNKHKTQFDWLEGRRRRAWELKQQGWKQEDIARALEVTPGAVSQWMRRAREGGMGALHHPPAKGPQIDGRADEAPA